MLRRCRSLVLMTALLLSAPLFAASYSQLVVIGDSLSDTGNLYNLTATLPPFLGIPVTPPSPPYSNGRFSNGPVYAEYLNSQLGLDPLAPSRLGGTDYAYGGALVSATALGIIPSLSSQRSTLLFDRGGSLDPNALYVVWGGNNDLFGLLGQSLTPQMAKPLVEGVANLLVSIVGDLVVHGAQHLLVPNIPDLGLTPAELGNANATQYSQWFNSQLSSGLASIQVDITLFDTFSTLQQLAPTFAHSTSGCIGLPTGCTDYLFFDDKHPTSAAHQILAERMYAQLTAVPLPAGVWLFGSAVTLLLVRRRG